MNLGWNIAKNAISMAVGFATSYTTERAVKALLEVAAESANIKKPGLLGNLAITVGTIAIGMIASQKASEIIEDTCSSFDILFDDGEDEDDEIIDVEPVVKEDEIVLEYTGKDAKYFESAEDAITDAAVDGKTINVHEAVSKVLNFSKDWKLYSTKPITGEDTPALVIKMDKKHGWTPEMLNKTKFDSINRRITLPMPIELPAEGK